MLAMECQPIEVIPNIYMFPEQHLRIGGFRANCYCLHLKDHYVVIDPSLQLSEEGEPILPAFPNLVASQVSSLVATHGHYDHLVGLNGWREQTEAPFIFPLPEKDLLFDPDANASIMLYKAQTYAEAECYYDDLDEITLDKQYILLSCHTPGHTHGSMCLFLLDTNQPGMDLTDNSTDALAKLTPRAKSLVEKMASRGKIVAVFSGDTVFARTIGRTDLVVGSMAEMTQSLQLLKQIFHVIPEDTVILPGHGEPTTVKAIVRENFYLF